METSSVLPDTIEQQQCNYCGTVLWLCVCITTTVVTVLGNVLTILAILLSKRLSSMMANYFVFSLAIGDLLVGFSIPYHMLFYMIGEDFGSGKTSCLLRFVFTSFACSSSITNLLLIAMDRYVAIVYPLHYGSFMTKKRVCIFIAASWVTATTMASVPLMWNDWHEGVRCELVHVVPHNFLAWVVCPTFALIWTAMLLLYARICREANGHVRRIRETTSSQDGQVMCVSTRDSKSFQLTLMILGCFTISWIPYFVITLYIQELVPNVYEISLNLAMANSSMNPLIYAWKNTNFRKAFLCLLKCRTPDDSPRYITDHVPSKRGSMNNIADSEKNESSEMNKKQDKAVFFANHCSKGRYDSTYETVISIK
ncbi:unnamed protein product [Acanthoscelides obtectus]|uniref:G-protein coupled receptors family 1 profile domain-containing protein n=1 Tax=Acanthoscelides obtectus TaxID=200917 RepID=A0A9P0P8P5_ACAOB|nr:unnamed protein product [Acanthoscelides obtectus]CAK1625627.1 Histamine H2 receptor [Acanthoscelides obtectus]